MIEYPRDLPSGYTPEMVMAEHAHVIAYLSAVASADDDPETNADDVDVVTTIRPDGGLRITGYLDAEPNAPYLQDEYDGFEGIDPELLKAAGL